MTVNMPRVRQMPSANYTPVSIRHDIIAVHHTEGGYEGSCAWLCDPRANASAHLVLKMDGSEVTQLVPLSQKAWAEVAGNGLGVSLEIEGYTAQGMTEQTMKAAALIIAWLCRAYAIPPVWAQGGRGRGIAQHVDGGAAWGGHSDALPLGGPAWMALLGLVKAAYEAFDDGPLPPFALHGAPGPAEVVPTPDVPPQASHGGAARNEPGDIHAHATPSLYPAHSIAALQSDLNALGAFPALTVDGRFGDKTRSALRQFQIVHKLTADGQIGPESWAALDAAMAPAKAA